jgi:predicted glutamine amidotransferase
MCGLYGFSGKTLDKNLLTILALQNMTRGVDSSGIYLENQASYWYEKEIGSADVFIEGLIKDKTHGYNKKDIINVIGHDRAKTVGLATKENAHPFMFLKKHNELNKNEIVLAHNGTLKDYYKLINKYEKIKHADVTVDSQLFACYLSRYDDYEVLKEFEGAAALLWKSINKTTLHAFRNAERPLHYGMIGENMYISSLELALNLIGCKDIKEFEERKIYTIEDGVITDISEVIPHVPHIVPSTRTSSTNSHVKNTPISLLSEKQLNKLVKKMNKSGDKKRFPSYEFNLSKSKLVRTDNILEFSDNYGNDISIDTATFYNCNFKTPRVKIRANHKLLSPIIELIYDKSYNYIEFIHCNSEEISEASEDEFIQQSSNSQGSIADYISSDSVDFIVVNDNDIDLVILPAKNFVECPQCNGTGFEYLEKSAKICDKCLGTTEIQIDATNNEIEIINNDENELFTEEQMDEIKKTIAFLKKFKQTHNDVLSSEEKTEIVVQIKQLQTVFEEQENLQEG